LKTLDVIQREKLADSARQLGDSLKSGLQQLSEKFPAVIRAVRGLGLMLGMELAPNIPNLPGDPNKTPAARFATLLHAAGLLTIPAGGHVLRLLPPLNLRQSEAQEALAITETVCQRWS
jgi:4-aminobutyrate aminotransferase-like enzyme